MRSFLIMLKEKSRRQTNLPRVIRRSYDFARVKIPIFGGKNQIAARPKNIVEEKDPIIRSDRQQKRVELCGRPQPPSSTRSQEHTSQLQSHLNLVFRLLLEKKKTPMLA